jgi:accessory gene regulator B
MELKMVEALASRIAMKLKEIEPEKTQSVAVMKFALEAIINTAITISFITVIALVTNSVSETFIALGAYGVLRFFSGGLHLRSSLNCSLVSTMLISASPHIYINQQWTIIASIVALILILIYAPANMEGHARIPTKYFPALKWISIAIICTNFIWFSSTIAIVFLIQAVTTISIRRR